jgi:nucleoside-diphosphate-sugar epimerase
MRTFCGQGEDLTQGAEAAAAAVALLAGATHVVVTAQSGEDGDPILRNPALRAALAAAGGLVWVGYLSSVGVYGDQAGAEVTEATPPSPRSARAKRRWLAEEQWEALQAAGGWALLVLRLPGIYGPGRGQRRVGLSLRLTALWFTEGIPMDDSRCR